MPKQVITNTKEQNGKSHSRLIQRELATIRAGRANAVIT